MNGFWQGTALTLTGVILALVLGKKSEHTGLIICVAVCCMVANVAISYLTPAVELIQNLQIIGKLDNQMITTLLKAVGIGLITELASMICSDAGMGTMGKSLQMLGSGVILWMSLPMMNQLLVLLQNILGGV